MGIYIDAVKAKKNFAIWGCGKYLEENILRLDPSIQISFICDKNEEKWNKCFTDLEIPCTSPQNILAYKDIVVLIAVLDKKVSEEISEWLNQRNIINCHLNEAIREYQCQWEEKEITKYDKSIALSDEPDQIDKMKYFINASVPVELCNLQCKYCYIGQGKGMNPKEIIFHSPQFIRKAFSRKRLGGTALINFCGVGETLLCKELVPIILELLEEGHYISIITNATIKKSLEDLLEVKKEYCDRLFFKCSFHYRELKRRNLLNTFAENIHYIDKKEASYSVELVPEDEIIPMIDEIKDFSIKQFGALPHLTVTRDESKEDIPILSKYTENEYKNIWREFKSPMFEVKMKYREHRKEYCLAGKNSFILDLATGDVCACPFNKSRDNFYDNISQKVSYTPVGHNCRSRYCINAHAYLTLGLIKEIKDYSYLEIRDRRTITGETWVKSKMSKFLCQRIWDNCLEEGNDAYE